MTERIVDRYLVSPPDNKQDLQVLKERIHSTLPDVVVIAVKVTCLVIEATEAEAQTISRKFNCRVSE